MGFPEMNFDNADGSAHFFQRTKSENHLVLDADQYRLKERNIVIVGDVHGCFQELETLLDMYVEKNDLVILAGDFINKGPKSLNVLRYAREHNFLGVIGNHEIASVRNCFARRLAFSRSEPEIPFVTYEWTDSMNERDLDYLLKLPFTISIPYHNAIVVHAGLVPGVPVELQNPKHMSTMRNLKIQPDGTYEPLENCEVGEAWASLWKGPEHVYFGHDAKRRLQQHQHATGLDTGCLYGDQLSAVILSPKGRRQLVHVHAAKKYFPVPPAPSVHLQHFWPTKSPSNIKVGIGILVGCAATFALAFRFSFRGPKGKST